MEKGQEQLTITMPTRATMTRSIHLPRVAVLKVVLPRRLGPAWMVSLVVHGCLLILALWGFGREIAPPAPTVHLVFVALPPPLPPLLGLPEDEGSAPKAEVSLQKMEKPPSLVKPKPSKRLVSPKCSVS